MIEEWQNVAGYDGLYKVSDLGRVRSLDKMVRHWRGGWRLARGVILMPRVVRAYHHVTLQDDGFIKQFSVHRLVALAFVPNPESKAEVNHKDGCKTNNQASNLEWVTKSENSIHAYQSGLVVRQNGEANHRSVLTESDIRTIRSRLSRGETCVDIAADYPVTDRAISRIKRRRVWSHL